LRILAPGRGKSVWGAVIREKGRHGKRKRISIKRAKAYTRAIKGHSYGKLEEETPHLTGRGGGNILKPGEGKKV